MAQIGDKITITATVKTKHEYQTHYAWVTQTHTIFVFEDADGQVYVWNTQSWFSIKTETLTSETGETRDIYDSIERGDIVTIKGTIKEFGEYNGTPQTVLTRVKVIERTFRADRWEEIQAAKQAAREAKREAQLASLQGEDFIWEMPYAQYKEYYSDCETVTDSYRVSERGGCKLISVIIREGRLKGSGVRGKTFNRYAFRVNLNDKEWTWAVYKAVDFDHAEARVKKEYPDCSYELDKIYWSGC